jgi:two-component system nitrate/nitrite response regulator NarL
LHEDHAFVKVVMFGVAESEAAVLRFVEAGAAGYVVKSDSVDELVDNIRAAYRGEALVSPEIAGALMSRVTEFAQVFAETTPESVELTPREREVLKLVAKNLSNREIADRLVIEVGTVKNHVHSILQKLNASSRENAAAYWSIIQEHGG